jgi:hypothetical protein
LFHTTAEIFKAYGEEYGDLFSDRNNVKSGLSQALSGAKTLLTTYFFSYGTLALMFFTPVTMMVHELAYAGVVGVMLPSFIFITTITFTKTISGVLKLS